MATDPNNKGNETSGGNDKSETIGQWLKDNDKSVNSKFTHWLRSQGYNMNGTFAQEIPRVGIDHTFVQAWATHENVFAGVIGLFIAKMKEHSQSGM